MTVIQTLKELCGLHTLYFAEMYKARKAETILICLGEISTFQQKRKNVFIKNVKMPTLG